MRIIRIVRLFAISVLTTGMSPVCMADPEYTGIQLEPVADGLTAPHLLISPPGEDRRFVVDQIGIIHVLGSDGSREAQPFLDVSNRMVDLNESYDERGLLGMAFHPDYRANGKFYVYYSAPLRQGAPSGWNHTSHVAEFRRSADPLRADAASERILMKLDQPQGNHNGGRLAFGPDGYLYIGLGDGGNAGDLGTGHPELGNGQDVTTLHGSILRIDVNSQPYGIPGDNPLVHAQLPSGVDFSGSAPRKEIYAWGIRNIWGMSFDRETGDLIAADVGQNLWEEINVIKKGNYGWRIKEGKIWFNPDQMNTPSSSGPATGPLGNTLIDPVIAYKNISGHSDGIGTSAIGGYVYRGSEIPSLQGRYVFGDWSSSRNSSRGVVMVAEPSDGSWPYEGALNLNKYLLGFGEDGSGELYVLVSGTVGPSGNTGEILAIRKAAARD